MRVCPSMARCTSSTATYCTNSCKTRMNSAAQYCTRAASDVGMKAAAKYAEVGTRVHASDNMTRLGTLEGNRRSCMHQPTLAAAAMRDAPSEDGATYGRKLSRNAMCGVSATPSMAMNVDADVFDNFIPVRQCKCTLESTFMFSSWRCTSGGAQRCRVAYYFTLQPALAFID